MELKGSKTEQNLLASFAGESMARSRYTFYADVAKNQGYEQIAALFMETAENERAHAKQVLKFLSGIGETPENLENAAYGEHEEWAVIYKEAAEVAAEEGFKEIANYFRLVCEVERDHEERFRQLKENVEKNKVFQSDEPKKWICRNCGYVHEGTEAPGICPVCRHPKAYFQQKCENY